MPELGWDELSRALRHRLKPTRVPLPEWITAPTVVPEHDPDPIVREAARAEIRAKTK